MNNHNHTHTCTRTHARTHTHTHTHTQVGRRRTEGGGEAGEEEAGGVSLLEWLSVFVQHSSCWEHDYTEVEGEWLGGNAVEGLLGLRLRLRAPSLQVGFRV